ncbi:hypothetical protein, partial [Fulvivirga lutimaris]|uniref:hypothetical protein n=1 Tax=Fulvivirga lutimaris TaxID=1819566 RepID=UPI001C87F63A
MISSLLPHRTNTGGDIVGNISVTSSKDGCVSSTPETFSITISPDNVITQKANIAVCPGDLISVGAFTVNTGANVTWT